MIRSLTIIKPLQAPWELQERVVNLNTNDLNTNDLNNQMIESVLRMKMNVIREIKKLPWALELLVLRVQEPRALMLQNNIMKKINNLVKRIEMQQQELVLALLGRVQVRKLRIHLQITKEKKVAV